MYNHELGTAPDFSTAAMAMLGLNLMWIFTTLWAIWGLVPVVLLGLGMNEAISRFAEGDD